jgi:hypothetical protein
MYDPKNIERIEKIPGGQIIDGIVIDIVDGTPRTFIKDEAKLLRFKNQDEPVIMVFVEFKYKDRVLRTEQLFSYINSTDGKTLFVDGSNMGKYFKQYGHPPTVSDKVQLLSNAQGYFKIVL